MKRSNRGFTLIEVIVVAAIIAILAGILVPMIFNQIDESKVTRATGDVKTLSTAVQRFRNDIGWWPSFDLNSATPSSWYDVLYSDGTVVPLDASFSVAQPSKFIDHLSSAAQTSKIYGPGGAFEKRWKGPYLTTFTPDPWGNAYAMSVYLVDKTYNVWILSAGPDGKFQTTATDVKPQGDDIGVTLGADANK